VPFIFVSGGGNPAQATANLAAGASDHVLKSQLWQLPSAIRRALAAAAREEEHERALRQNAAMRRLVTAVQDLSLARSMEAVAEVVRRAARELTGADGASFVLRDGDRCYYADEDAISPLWKGQRFPMSACISGWVMLNKQPVVIEDIYADSRIPVDAYRPTFVKSLAMTPIRTASPIGAIGNYWATPHRATPDEIEILQALANTTAVALESVELYAKLEQRVRDRTAQLEAANRELETFSYSVSHDLQAPLRAIDGFAHRLAAANRGKLDDESNRFCERVCSEAERAGRMVDDLLRLARFVRIHLSKARVDLTQIAGEQIERLRASEPERQIEFTVEEGLNAWGDEGLLRVVLENLLANAWKYSSKRERAIIELGSALQPDGEEAFFVRDNGAGFDLRYATKLFAPFQRMHASAEFPGSGIGLATVQRIIYRHGGRIWAEAEVEHGATFYFTLPEAGKGRMTNDE
jgi:hypothetical protein